MKLTWIIALMATSLAVSAVTAQEANDARGQNAPIVSVPHQAGRAGGPVPAEPPAGAQGSGTYPEQLEAVLNTMSAELAEIAQAVREGTISRAQGEYLSMERYYVAMTRFQFLRTMYQGPDDTTPLVSNDQKNVAPQVAGNTAALPALTCSPDLPQQLVAYLQLTPVQLDAIERKVTEQCKQIEPLMDKLESSRRREIAIKVSGQFDVHTAQSLAAEQSDIIKQLLLANSRLETALYSMLTSEQKQKVDGLLRQSLGSATNAGLREW